MIGLNKAFNFATPQLFMITKNTAVRLDEGFTFNYDPLTNSTNLSQFADRSATLCLLGATLQAANGLSLTNGTFLVKRNSYLKTTITSELDGDAIVFGDGNPDHDPRVVIYNSIFLRVASGTCNIRTVQPDSFIIANGASELAIAALARLNIYNSILLDPGVLTLQNDFLFGVSSSSGGEFLGKIIIPGDYTFINM